MSKYDTSENAINELFERFTKEYLREFLDFMNTSDALIESDEKEIRRLTRELKKSNMRTEHYLGKYKEELRARCVLENILISLKKESIKGDQ